MQNHYELSDTAFEQRFKAGTFPPELFTHEAHLRLAWIHIQHYGVAQAEQNIVSQLKHFVTLVGAEDKFNMTLTVAAVKVVAHFISKENYSHFKDFIAAYPRLLTHFKEMIAQHYNQDIYHSEQAKKVFLTPDLLPFK
ncbi:conserved hypothetical protein [Flavobacterium sp. 9AF]|uniref:hypothetical protein n=1 Tax=Flavobacterium sp. 9AF TaxID=2653142 RepID=UPI0012F23DC7|nr:hypothetical protein [Flavobacterium sp. 9AF]VXB08172.1 conserved hypothetical protein [Flavobacterium sp. 9AF]